MWEKLEDLDLLENNLEKIREQQLDNVFCGSFLKSQNTTHPW